MTITTFDIDIVPHADGTGTANVYEQTEHGPELVSSTPLDWRQMAALAAACPDGPEGEDD